MLSTGGTEVSLFPTADPLKGQMTADNKSTGESVAGEKTSSDLNSLNTPDILGYMEPTIDLDTFMRQNPFFMDGFNISPSVLGQAFTQQCPSDQPAMLNSIINQDQQAPPRESTYVTSGQTTSSYPGFYQQHQQDFVNNNANSAGHPNDQQMTVMDISYATSKVKEEPIDAGLTPQTASHLRPDSAPTFHFVPSVEQISPPGTPQSSDSFRSARPYGANGNRSRKAHADKNTNEYRMKRLKNNIAVRKSREKAKSKQQLTEIRIAELEAQVDQLRQENIRLKAILQHR